MRRSTAGLFFIAIVVGLLAAAFLLRDPPRRPALEPIVQGEIEAIPGEDKTVLEEIPAPAPSEARARESTNGSSTQELLAVGPQWNLRVIDAPTGALVPGADVYFFSPQRISEVLLIEDPNVFFAMTRFYERYGLHRKTDERGFAEIPVVEDAFWVVAMTPTRFGGASYKVDAAPNGYYDLSVLPSEFLEVRVLAERNRSPLAGVAVAFRDEELMSFPIGARSDGQGLARLGPCEARADEEPARFVTVHGVFSKPVETWVRAGSLPRPELLVPDSERLLVRIVDSRGKLAPVDGQLSIDWNGRPKASGNWPKVPIRAGTVSIPRVESGVTLSLRAELNGIARKFTKQFTMPLSTRDQSVDIELDLATPIVRARLMRADGPALESARWEINATLACVETGESRIARAGKVRGRGAIAFALGDMKNGACEASIALRAHAATGEEVGGVFYESLRPDTNDLGEWALEPATLLCAGRLVDQRGVGIAGRAVELRRAYAHGVLILATPAASSGGDGRFEVRGWGDPDDYLLEVSGTLRTHPVKLGETGITIVVDY